MHAWGAVDLRIYLTKKNHGYSISAQSYDFCPRLIKLDILDFTLSLMWVQCEIKDIKLYQVRTKIIALGWYLVTMIFLGQINRKIHYSPGMHNVPVITKKILYKSVKASWKWTIFSSFMVQFLLITCLCSHISLKNKLHAHTLHTFLTLSAF